MNPVLLVAHGTIWLVMTTVTATALAVAGMNLALVMLYKDKRNS